MAAMLFVLHALLTIAVVAFLLRVLMPLVRADFRNPLGQAVLRFTDPLVRPLRRVVPPAGKIDLASVAALLVVQFAGTALIRLVAGGGFAAGPIVVIAFKELLRTVLQFFTVAILVQAVVSWVAPGTYNPATQLLARLCEPLLRPFRRLLPPIGGLDFSPIFVLIGLQALLILLG